MSTNRFKVVRSNPELNPLAELPFKFAFHGSFDIPYLQFYNLGAAQYLKDHFFLDKSKIIGVSGGSIVAACVALDVDLNVAKDVLINISQLHTDRY